MKNNIKSAENNSIILWTICFILFLPVIILPPSFLPSDWTKAILFKTAITLLLSFLFFKFFYKKELSISLPKWDFHSFLPILMLLAYSALLVVSTIFSKDPFFSFFGSPARSGGILNFLFYVFFAVFIALFIKERAWEKLWTALFISGILASLVAFIQYFSFFGKIFVSREGGNTPSVLGNSTFLAIFMLFLCILALLMFIKEKTKKKKIFFAVLFCVFAFTIFISGSRAAYIALASGLFYFFLFFPLEKGLKKSRKLKIAQITAMSILALLVIFIAYVNLVPKFPSFIENDARMSYLFHNRLSAKTLMRDLAGTRFSAWQITFEAIKEKPLLGWGPENFYIGFEKYYDPLLGDIKKTWWDRPHNIFLEIWASSGIFALILYASFWILMLWALQKLKAKSQLPVLAHGLQTMFLCYLAVLFFNFDGFSTCLISFLFIGYSFYLFFENKEKIIITPPSFLKKPVLVFIAIFAFAFIWFWNIKPLYANEKIIYIQSLVDAKKCNNALVLTDKVWKNAGILKSYSGLKYSTFLKECAPLLAGKEVELAQKGLAVLKASAKIQPNFTRTWLFMAGFANVLAAKENSQEAKNNYLLEAKSYLDKALELSPKRQEILIELAKNYLISGDYEKMKKVGKDCVKIDDYWGECYWYFGVAEVFLGEQEAGKEHVRISEEKGYGRPPFMQLAAAFLSQKNYKDAASVYKQIVFYYPENAEYHATAAFLYRQIGQYSQAALEALAVFELQPENTEAVDFLREMLALSPDSADTHYAWAMVYKKKGDNAQKIRELKIALPIYEQLSAENPISTFYREQIEKIIEELKYE